MPSRPNGSEGCILPCLLEPQRGWALASQSGNTFDIMPLWLLSHLCLTSPLVFSRIIFLIDRLRLNLPQGLILRDPNYDITLPTPMTSLSFSLCVALGEQPSRTPQMLPPLFFAVALSCVCNHPGGSLVFIRFCSMSAGTLIISSTDVFPGPITVNGSV